MSAFMEKYHINKALRTSLTAAQAVWGWTRDRLWPIYTAAVFLSVFQMIAIASEKQIIADHYYGGASGKFEEEKDDLVRNSRKLFHEEVSVAVKERVWQLPPSAFRREYDSRLGSA